MSYVGAFFLVGLLILVHEAGHLAAAKLVGIPVAGFSVGFGPRLWSRRWGRTEYALRAVPLGGFVLPEAEDPEEFRALPLGRRIVFFLGGPLANLVFCMPLLAAFYAMQRGLSLANLVVLPCVKLTDLCRDTLTAIFALFVQPEALGGLVGIVGQGGEAVHKGYALEFAVTLSVSLAVLNLLPIPILDGGQILLGCLERLFPRFTRLRVPLTVLGMVVLASLMIYANAQDVVRILNLRS